VALINGSVEALLFLGPGDDLGFGQGVAVKAHEDLPVDPAEKVVLEMPEVERDAMLPGECLPGQDVVFPVVDDDTVHVEDGPERRAHETA
jgi:hypothetical protein